MSEKRKVWAIEADVLDMVNEAAKGSFPHEFAAVLRAERGVITEILLLPGSISTDTSATMTLYNLPIDFSMVGTVHSHPGPSNRPSDHDLHLFGSFGNTHIITCLPFDMTSWRAYDFKGDVVKLEVLE